MPTPNGTAPLFVSALAFPDTSDTSDRFHSPKGADSPMRVKSTAASCRPARIWLPCPTSRTWAAVRTGVPAPALPARGRIGTPKRERLHVTRHIRRVGVAVG